MLQGLGNHLLTITVSRLQVIRSSNRSQTWALSYSNVLRQDVQSQLALKPSPSAFAASLKHGSKCTVPSAGTSMERRYGSLRKRQLLCASAKVLRSEQTQIQSYARRSVFLLTDCGASTRCVRGGPGDCWQEQQSPIMKPGTPSRTTERPLPQIPVRPRGYPVRVLLPEHAGGDNRPAFGGVRQWKWSPRPHRALALREAPAKPCPRGASP